MQHASDGGYIMEMEQKSEGAGAMVGNFRDRGKLTCLKRPPRREGPLQREPLQDFVAAN